MEYKLIEAASLASLNKEVTEHLQADWHLYGPPVITALPQTESYDPEWAYCQAVIKDDA